MTISQCELLKREKELKPDTSSFPPHITKRCFEFLSYHTISRGHMGRFSPREIFPNPNDYEQLLQINSENFGRLTQLGIIYEIWEGGEREGEIVFRHQSFQEYFASCELKRRIISNGKVDKDKLKEHLEYNKWDEVLFFLIGFLEPEVAKEIISFISPYDFFSAKCIANYKGNKDEDFKEIIDNLFKQISRDDAREALARIGTESIIRKLIDSLKDEDSDVRMAAAVALGRCSKGLKGGDLVKLVENLHREGYNDAVDKIKEGSWQAVYGDIYPRRTLRKS